MLTYLLGVGFHDEKHTEVTRLPERCIPTTVTLHWAHYYPELRSSPQPHAGLRNKKVATYTIQLGG